MTRIHLKQRSPIQHEIWTEVWNTRENEWECVSESRLIFTPDTIIIDSMTIYPPHQRKGYGMAMIQYLKRFNRKVIPMGVLRTAEGFWDKATPGWRTQGTEDEENLWRKLTGQAS